jgi:RNA polymerase sigma factor (sigma-70 family)
MLNSTATVSKPTYITDEQLIAQYRSPQTTDSKRVQIFKTLLMRKRENETKASWDTVIRKYVRWRISKSRHGFDIYNEDDLYQRCLCCLYKAMSEKFDFSFCTKFSTYMYTALEKTVNRVLVELRKKKRTVEICVEDANGKKVTKRLSPHYFTDSLSKPVNNDDSSGATLSDIIADKVDDISEDEAVIAEAILNKCKKELTPMQYDIFIRSDIQGLITGKELAKKYNKSEPTISAIKKRKIARAIKKIRHETIEEFDLVADKRLVAI